MALLPAIGSQYDRCLYGFYVELDTPGGPLPFKLSYFNTPHTGTGWDGHISIGQKRTRVVVESPTNSEHDIVVRFPHFDSTLQLSGVEDQLMTGSWTKTRGGTAASLSARSAGSLSDATGFAAIDTDVSPANFDGRWRVNFSGSEEDAIGSFYQIDLEGDPYVMGTFETTTGDYRYLAGRVDGPYLRLSTFDGAHAFLFHARMQDDGSLKGDFWSGNWHHEEWTAVRDENATLPDAFEQTTVADEEALEELIFKDIDGNPTRVLDALDATNAPARVLEIFGTWCPNCADAGRELVSLKDKYGDKLGVVGLAFEITEDFERSATQVRRHHKHIGSDWQVLIAGLSDKDKATATLGFLDRVRSYPTLVFLNADSEVRAVYSGFSGPATGEAYTKQRERFEAMIEGMIGE